MVTWYRVYYHHPMTQTVVDITGHFHMFTEEDASQRVYTVSVQALSQHLLSAPVGPLTARGQSVGVWGTKRLRINIILFI